MLIVNVSRDCESIFRCSSFFAPPLTATNRPAMANWKDTLARLAHQTAATVEERFDELRYEMHERLGRTDPIVIQPYRGFGTEKKLRVWGRVLEDEGIHEATDRDSIWKNLLASYRRFESDEVPGVRVRARYAGAEQVALTDEEGYFDLYLEPTEELPADRLWHEVDVELLDDVQPGRGPVQAKAPVLVPPVEAAFGVISDVDDTILKTDATNLMAMARLTFLRNAHTRLPFEGVAAFYRALEKGPGGDGANPIFFVSSSPWNLFDFLADFCDLHGIPRGPLLLRDLGLDRNKFIKAGHHTHKLAQIEHVLATYPDLPFVLIGDSGQEDPEIYQQVIKDFPGRVRVAYIRDVSVDERDAIVRKIAEGLGTPDVEMVLTADSAEAAEHAADVGLIDPEALPNVRAEKAKDEAPPGEAEQLADAPEREG